MRSPLLLALLLSVACGPPVPDHGAAASESALSFEPDADPSAVSNVVHIHVPGTRVGAGSALLFQGSLSDYYLSKVKHGEIPDTLAAREIPVLSWLTSADLVVAPVLPLLPGPYALAGSTGLLGEFQVSTELPVLSRVWPSPGLAGSARYAVFCGEGAPLPSPAPLTLEPVGVQVQLLPGADDAGSFPERCLHFSASDELAPAQIAVPEPVLASWALDPSAFAAGSAEPVSPLSCEDGEQPLGLGCVLTADDRLLLRTPNAPLLWLLHTEHGALLQVTRDGVSVAVRGLSPSTHEHVWGSVHDESGAALSFDSFFDTGAARARPVLNEVLANPLGPEPQGEWLELVNDGSLALDLSAYSLQDDGGNTALPAAQIGPGEYVLLVRNDFAPNASDQPPAASARLIRMPTLGKAGLSNSGERLALLDSAGQECSVMPALPTKPGLSLARRHPWSLDDDPDAFSYGPPTPGTPNDAAAP